MTTLAQFIRQTKQEISKITWPTRAETMRGTFVVIVMSIILALFLVIIDLFFARFVGFVIGG